MNADLIEDYMSDMLLPNEKTVSQPSSSCEPTYAAVMKSESNLAEVALSPPEMGAPCMLSSASSNIYKNHAIADEMPPAALLSRLTEGSVKSKKPGHSRSDVAHRWLRFSLAEQFYAVEILKVQEVIRVPDILPLRGADSDILGVMNLRGQIVPVIDLGRRLRTPDVVVSAAARIIVLEVSGEMLGALVTSVAEVVRITAAQIEYPDSLCCGTACTSLYGVCRLGGHPTLLLDAALLLA